VTVGPSQALYPFTPFRNSFNYVPNDYDAGGRTTAIAISDTCVPGNCRIFITPAGGGSAHQERPHQPRWEYLAARWASIWRSHHRPE
jgi:hypothetical protein